MKRKIWYFVSILFCFYSLSILNDERYEVTYVKGNENEEAKYLACINLKILNLNKTEVDLNELKEKLYNHSIKINNEEKKLYWWSKYQENFDKFILNPIKSGNYLIWHYQVCWFANDREELWIINNYSIDKLKLFAFEKDTFQFFNLKNSQNFNKLVVQNEEYPYSKCTDKNYSEFRCLNDCFKANATRSSKYYYDGNETGLIYLNYDQNDKSISENEMNCFNQCKEKMCKLTYFSQSISEFSEKFFKAKPIMSNFNYWVQLVGLIILFIGTSSYQLLSTSTKLIITKTKKNEMKRFIFYIKISTLLIILAYTIYLYASMVTDHKNKEINPAKKETKVNLMKPETMNLAICLRLDQESYMNKTFLELEKDSDIKFNETVREIYLENQNKKIKINWIIKSKVLFRQEYLIGLLRCFQIEIHPNEAKHQMLLPISKLIIKFKNDYYSLFLLSQNENLNSRSYQYSKYVTFIKNETKRQVDCVDYEKAYPSCTSQWNCIDSCINRKLFDKYHNITLEYQYVYGSVIDKNQFTDQEWSNSFLNSDFDYPFYNQIEEKCIQKYSKESCNEIKFEDDVKTSQKDSNDTQIDLNYDVIKTVDEAQSWYKLSLDLLNIQSIFFGLSAFKIVEIIYDFIQKKLKIRDNKISIFIFYLICSFGFIIHIYQILNLVINEELTSSQHYEVPNKIQMPDLIFCFEFDEKLIDKNHKFNENYLERITEDLNAKKIFESISYLNESNEWIELSSNLTDCKLKITGFYYLNQKCFVLKQESEYSKNQFHFSANYQVLKVKFNQTFIKQNQNSPYFMTKKQGTMQLSKINRLDYSEYYRPIYSINQELFLTIYQDKFNLIKNPLSLFSGENDLNDVDKYLLKLVNNFEETYKLVTLNFPIEKKNSINKIDDDLFEEYLGQIQNLIDSNSPAYYERESAVNYLQGVYRSRFKKDLDLYDFEFGLIFFKKVVKTTNEDNYAKLILNLLNSLSIWFDLSVLDLYAYSHFLYFYVFITYLIHKINYFFVFIHKFLLKIDIFLHRSLLRV